MIIPHNTILITVVDEAFAPPDERLLTSGWAPVGTQRKQMCG